MSQVVEGQVDGIVATRHSLFAGNTNATMQPMDVNEAAYYKLHPEEAPGTQQETLVDELKKGFANEISYRLGATLAPPITSSTLKRHPARPAHSRKS